MENVISMSNIERYIILYNIDSSQSTEWKFVVSKAMKDNNIAKNDIARVIRSE